MTISEILLQDFDTEISNTRRTLERVTTRANALQKLDESAAACRKAIAEASDEALAAPWKFSFGDQIISHSPRSLAFRQMCFDHLIHHTAQLGVYLRLNDIPVPALYGPSADEQWGS